MAKGNAYVPAMEMTKWFDTNYHYIVPELGPEVNISYSSHKVVKEYKETKVALARLRFSSTMDYSDVNEALRLMQMSKFSLYSEDRQKSGLDAISDILLKL